MSEYCERFPSMMRAYCSHCLGTAPAIPSRVKQSRPIKSDRRRFGVHTEYALPIPAGSVRCVGCELPIPWGDTRYGLLTFLDETRAPITVKFTRENTHVRYNRTTDSVYYETENKRIRVPVTKTGRVCGECQNKHQFVMKDEYGFVQRPNGLGGSGRVIANECDITENYQMGKGDLR